MGREILYDSFLLSEVCIFLDQPSIASLRQVNSHICNLLLECDDFIYSNELFNICKKLFINNDDGSTSVRVVNIWDSFGDFRNYIKGKRGTVSCLELFKELLFNPMVLKSSNDFSNEIYGQFINYGGCMEYSITQPCRIIGWMLRDFCSKENNNVMMKFHKFCLLSHFAYTSNVEVIYSNEAIDPYTKLHTPNTSNFIVNIWNKMFPTNSESEPPKKHGFVNNFMTDIIKEMRTIDLLLNILDEFKTFRTDNPPPPNYNEIIFHTRSDPSVFNFTPLNNSILEPLKTFSDILTYHHWFAYTPDPLLPTTYPKLRRQFLGIEDEENFSAKHYDHLIMYDWTTTIGGGLCSYWLYAMEYFTHSFYRLDTGEFVVFTTNPQD
ncbi:predicted protein [Naegleria gruberi]|uniref:Predicted protein n=1 Tax=Naegleria gruberi TaxID=5762 RepID=D2V114_NAEGR|nr:uncharacterized protein NAEGRDRAFT_62489 [Naegleria gruberi]EFC49826.1 predicted protein [Naegleria gruberi]|eukprot:XP_002682570.1 predicted protein [Naegleria gruberi strain NEG-M]